MPYQVPRQCGAILCRNGDFLNGQGASAVNPLPTALDAVSAHFGSGPLPTRTQRVVLQAALDALRSFKTAEQVQELHTGVEATEAGIRKLGSELEALSAEILTKESELEAIRIARMDQEQGRQAAAASRKRSLRSASGPAPHGAAESTPQARRTTRSQQAPGAAGPSSAAGRGACPPPAPSKRPRR